MPDRDFDVVLYGATGFTGRQTVRYFAQHAPNGLRWAIAGRNRAKLEALNAAVPVCVAASDEPDSMDSLAARTRVVLSTAGPFELYSDSLVAACVGQRTAYVDITGETVWARTLIDRFHERAASDGTRIVPFCGFDCVPCDLGADWMFRRLGPRTAEIKACFQMKGGSPNGGTMATALHTWENGATRKMRDPFLLSPGISRAMQPLERDPRGAHYDADLRAWVAPWVMGVIDTRVVRRSNALLGRDCAYQEYTKFDAPLAAVKAVLFAGAGTAFETAMKIGSVRKTIRNRLPPGAGPSEEAMDGGWLRCELFGRSTDGRTARATLTGRGDPANRITVACVCEAALALACDAERLPARGGILTPASALGEVLLARLSPRGLTISDLT
jgi:short subunit dehydrogenase-like uncharacterized protein